MHNLILFAVLLLQETTGLSFFSKMNMFNKATSPTSVRSIVRTAQFPEWDALTFQTKSTVIGQKMDAEEILRNAGEGPGKISKKICNINLQQLYFKR